MKMRIHFTIPVAFVCILLAHGSQPKSSRIGPADIYPDIVRTPGAAALTAALCFPNQHTFGTDLTKSDSLD